MIRQHFRNEDSVRGSRSRYEDRIQVTGLQEQKDKDFKRRVAVSLILAGVRTNTWILGRVFLGELFLN